MRTPLLTGLACGCAFLAASLGGALPQAQAQGLGETMAVTEGLNTLNNAPVGSAAGSFNPIQRAQEAAGTPGAPAQPPPAPPPAPIAAIVQSGPVGPRIAVITGVRAFDAVTGVLLDDAQERLVPESQKDQDFDDGTHGDVQANDGKYTRIDESRDYLSQSNQRVKEELVQSLVAASGMSPLQFFGYTVMSTQRSEAPSRNRAWKLVPNPSGPGSVLKEVPIDQPLEIPKFRDKEAEKDRRVKDDWSDRFLQEFRKNKDSLLSDFYPLYIPMPPVPPTTAPPGNWHPFAVTTPASVLAPPAAAQPPGF